MTELRQERSDEGHIGMLGIESQIQTGVGIEWADIPPSRRTRTIGIVYRCIQKDPLRRFLPGAESRYGVHVYTVDSEAVACNACLHELPVCDVAQDSLSRHFHIEHVEVHSGQIQYVLQTDVIHTHTKRVGGRTAEYFIKVAEQQGKSKLWIATKHMFPLLISQIIVGVILMFPHAIMHEAGITFLGFGLSPHEPAIGIILAESMQYLSNGCWWLAFFPGVSLLIIVLLFDLIGEYVHKLLDPVEAQK